VPVRDFAGGVWHVYEIDGGAGFRVRTTTMRGDYAVLSAIAFDEAPPPTAA
jgi:hypothetical protein